MTATHTAFADRAFLDSWIALVGLSILYYTVRLWVEVNTVHKTFACERHET